MPTNNESPHEDHLQYIHPGKAFVKQFGLPQETKDVLHYVDFLRQEAKIEDVPPIQLTKIYSHFRMPIPHKTSLPEDTQGLLINPERGTILVNDSDPQTRQRFTEAHELMELLFTAFPSNKGWAAAAQRVGNFRYETKELLCNEGAAELLMPKTIFHSRIESLGISFQSARQVAAEFEVSTTAALVQMTRVGSGRRVIVLWRMKNKPTEIKNNNRKNQLSLFKDDVFDELPPKKLRVEWSMGGPNTPYIPIDKSVPDHSSIYSAWRDREFTNGKDFLDLPNIRGTCLCENKPFSIKDEWFVLSLVHLPGEF